MLLSVYRRKHRAVVFLCFLLIVCCIAFVKISVRVFSIDTIEVVGSNIQVIVNEKRISRNLLFFPSESFRREILVDNPWLKDVVFEKKFPHTLRIYPTIRTPAAIVVSQNRSVLVDASRMVLVDSDIGIPLPKIYCPIAQLRVGSTIADQRIADDLTFIALTSDFLQIKTITEYDGAYFLAKSDTMNIYISHQTPIEESIASLQTLFSGFRIKGTLPTVVDLRFDKPIVKF